MFHDTKFSVCFLDNLKYFQKKVAKGFDNYDSNKYAESDDDDYDDVDDDEDIGFFLMRYSFKTYTLFTWILLTATFISGWISIWMQQLFLELVGLKKIFLHFGSLRSNFLE